MTQEQRHLTTTPQITEVSVSTIADILEWTPRKSRMLTPAIHLRILTASTQLWNTTFHVFNESWLAAAAGSLLSRVVQYVFELSDERVMAAWSDLCAKLISASEPSLIFHLTMEDNSQQADDIRRKLWSLQASGCRRQGSRIVRREFVEFLSIPAWWDISSRSRLSCSRDFTAKDGP